MPCPHITSGMRCKICEEKPAKKKPKPIRKVSVKRVGENKEYEANKKQYLIDNPICEVENCNHKSNQIHHKKGRTGDLLKDIEHFLAVCDPCHKYIESNPLWAKIQGYSESRLV